jgi:hypothetical protein
MKIESTVPLPVENGARLDDGGPLSKRISSPPFVDDPSADGTVRCIDG